MSNPFFILQARLAELLRAHAYFAALPADAILTEEVGNIDTRVINELLPLGFGVVITTAKGDMQPSLTALRTRETITLAIIHNPTTEPDKSALAAVWAAVAAINGAPLFATTVVRSEDDCWRCIAHERRLDAPAELHVHHLTVSAALRLF